MNVFTMKLNSAEMAQKLTMLLQPDEKIIAAVFCSLEHAGITSISSVFVSYLGLTDRHRLIGCEFSLAGESTFSVCLQDVSKLRIKTGSLNQYKFRLESEHLTLNCRIGRDGGKRFPDQSACLDLMLPILEMYQS